MAKGNGVCVKLGFFFFYYVDEDPVRLDIPALLHPLSRGLGEGGVLRSAQKALCI